MCRFMGRKIECEWPHVVPLDNVKELTDEESQNVESVSPVDSGDVPRPSVLRKSSSEFREPNSPKAHMQYLRSNTEPINAYLMRANLKPVAPSSSVTASRCPAPIPPRSVVRTERQISQPMVIGLLCNDLPPPKATVFYCSLICPSHHRGIEAFVQTIFHLPNQPSIYRYVKGGLNGGLVETVILKANEVRA
ncbi:unnamed protein product [Mesocestoides corti]|uniref:Uncharacterized protein n=1 Tax=Mesocestoides corti TaxID=53468 RepID=A0A0R3UF57_MESCO|nr:unnamed protein product [Mesocestoides corti]